jgi:hypothetical protein
MKVKRNCRRQLNIRDVSPSSCVRSLGKNICGNSFFVRYYQRFCVGNWLHQCTSSYTIISDFAVSKSKGVVFDD